MTHFMNTHLINRHRDDAPKTQVQKRLFGECVIGMHASRFSKLCLQLHTELLKSIMMWARVLPILVIDEERSTCNFPSSCILNRGWYYTIQVQWDTFAFQVRTRPLEKRIGTSCRLTRKRKGWSNVLKASFCNVRFHTKATIPLALIDHDPHRSRLVT